MRVIVLRICCVAPPGANESSWNVPRLEYTASGLPPAFAGAQMQQATTITVSNERRKDIAHPLGRGLSRPGLGVRTAGRAEKPRAAGDRRRESSR